jgi:superfamily II DNA or RNA helicase
MPDIIIEKINASFLKLHADEGVSRHLYEAFRYNKPKFQKNPYTKWDGVVRLFNLKTKRFPTGLLGELLKFCSEHNYSFEVDPTLKEDIISIDKSDVDEWALSLDVHSKGEPIIPYEYQLEALHLSVTYGRLLLLAATSAGKSLITYYLARWYGEIGYESGKTLIIVPSIGLVSQLYKDFQDYSSANGWDVQGEVHCISEGAERQSNKNIFISTWQSLLKQDDDYFLQFARIIIDEAHLASGDSITHVCNKSIFADKRIGMTGTLNGTEMHEMQVTSLTGLPVRIVTTKQLQDKGRAAKTLVTFLNLDYPTQDRRTVYVGSYQDEIEFLVNHPYRNKVIKTLAMSLTGNSLLLFGRRDTHCVKLFDELVAMNLPGKKFHLIVGGVDADERDDIRFSLESSEDGIDHIIFATAKSASTGMSIKKLHNLVICHPNKSLVQTLQSLGRMLRLHDSKDVAHIFDIIDDLEHMNKANKTLEHGTERYGFYHAEGHTIQVQKYKVN